MSLTRGSGAGACSGCVEQVQPHPSSVAESPPEAQQQVTAAAVERHVAVEAAQQDVATDASFDDALSGKPQPQQANAGCTATMTAMATRAAIVATDRRKRSIGQSEELRAQDYISTPELYGWFKHRRNTFIRPRPTTHPNLAAGLASTAPGGVIQPPANELNALSEISFRHHAPSQRMRLTAV